MISTSKNCSTCSTTPKKLWTTSIISYKHTTYSPPSKTSSIRMAYSNPNKNKQFPNFYTPNSNMTGRCPSPPLIEISAISMYNLQIILWFCRRKEKIIKEEKIEVVRNLISNLKWPPPVLSNQDWDSLMIFLASTQKSKKKENRTSRKRKNPISAKK